MRRPPPRARMVNMSSVASNQSLKIDATTIAGPLERSPWVVDRSRTSRVHRGKPKQLMNDVPDEPPRDERDDLANAVKKNKFLRVVLVAKLEHDEDPTAASLVVNKKG
ncbi:hypothetical protein AaE_011177 [Aphanomyces astaci]|uniref:Uncharacterized protein n=1 Tax=Aphanomyces astaci TaxID=112090 RepID=A0A6A4ZUB4_APHAT|nr:hypothetical protein AaE_011177 [Aphanomyces astaci]